MFYLAAAVSDFYVPWTELPEHKIQSRGGELNLELQQVPKCLGLLRNDWAPAAFHVSFKLETDEQLLLHKAKAAITSYGVHCVVANELNTRTERCVSTVALLTAKLSHGLLLHCSLCLFHSLCSFLCGSGCADDVAGCNLWREMGQQGEKKIEEKLVKALTEMHLRHCQEE
jgi:DNA / pantothenate metabolism flavoprotein